MTNPFKKKEEVVTFEELFQAYCKMDPISNAMDVELIPLSQIEIWFKKAEILDMKNVTTNDTGLCFFKFRKRAINYEQFLEFMKDLSKTKNLDFKEMKAKLEVCPKPSTEDPKKKKKTD